MSEWDERYRTDEYIFGTAPNAFVAAQQPRLAGMRRVLAVADGEGRNSVWLAAQGLEVVAFDASPVGVAKARRLAAERGVNVAFEVADVYGWNWPAACFDAVFAIFVQFADPPMRAFLFERMQAAVRPGGLVFLEGYTPEQLNYKTGGPKQLAHLYTEPMLAAAFADCEILELRSYVAHLDEGSRHSGLSAIVDLVARRRPSPRSGPE